MASRRARLFLPRKTDSLPPPCCLPPPDGIEELWQRDSKKKRDAKILQLTQKFLHYKEPRKIQELTSRFPEHLVNTSRRSFRHDVAFCLPHIHPGTNLEASLRPWVNHQQRLGVGHFFFYTRDAAALIPHLENVSYDIIEQPWVDSLKNMTAQYGQAYVANDCLFRARVAEIKWAVFGDLDEYFWIPMEHGGTYQSLVEKSIVGYSVYAFPSKFYSASICTKASFSAETAPCHRSTPVACGEEFLQADAPCKLNGPGSNGRRKFMVLVNRVPRVGVHEAYGVQARYYKDLALNGSEGFIKHYGHMLGLMRVERASACGGVSRIACVDHIGTYTRICEEVVESRDACEEKCAALFGRAIKAACEW